MSSADPNSTGLPRHVAIIMDGNGRWASQRGQPRGFGHRAGGRAARRIIEASWEAGVTHLTLFAFSTENWNRPQQEVGLLMDLFLRSLKRDLHELHENDVRIEFIGAHGRFAPDLLEQMRKAQADTATNKGLRLNIAIGYGGRQDIVAGVRALAHRVKRGELDPEAIDEAMIQGELALGEQPPPDLFVRTGGEIRISNFLLWQLAYTELYFCDVLWPDFSPQHLQAALSWYGGRERRFGQVQATGGGRVHA